MLDPGYRLLGVREDGVGLALLAALTKESDCSKNRKDLRAKDLLALWFEKLVGNVSILVS